MKLTKLSAAPLRGKVPPHARAGQLRTRAPHRSVSPVFGRWNNRRGVGIVASGQDLLMENFTAVVEQDADTALDVGWVPGFPGAHGQGETLDELRANLQAAIERLLEEGDPTLESVFIGTQTVEVA